MAFVELDNYGLLPLVCAEVDVTNPRGGTGRTWTDVTPLVRQLSYTRSGRNQELNRSAAGSLSGVCSDIGGAITGLGLGKGNWCRVRATWPGTVAQILAFSPKLYWRLGESSLVATAADASPNGNTGSYGTGVSRGFPGSLVGSAAKAALFANSSQAGIVASSYQPFVVGSKRTFMGWAYRSATTDFDTLFGGSISGSAGAPFLRCQSGSEDVLFEASATAGTSSLTWAGAWPGTGQWVHWALTYDDSTRIAELFINGISQGQQTLAAGSAYSGAANDFFQLGALGGGAGTSAWGGYMQDVAIFESILTPLQIQLCYQRGTIYPRWQGILEAVPRKWPGQGADQLVELHAADIFKALATFDLNGQTFPLQRNDQRFSAILALAGITAGAVDTETDTADAVTTPFAEQSMALDYLLQIEDSESGLVIGNPDGSVSFQGRHWRYKNAALPVATFGENTGEIPYLDDVELDDDDSTVANIGAVTPYGGGSAIVVDGSASSPFWPNRRDVQLLSSDTSLATYAAQWIVKRYSDPGLRVPGLTVELAAAARVNPSLVATLLAAGNSSRFTWKRNASPPFQQDVYVEQIGETINVAGGSWQWKSQLSPVSDLAAWILGTSLLGQDTALAY